MDPNGEEEIEEHSKDAFGEVASSCAYWSSKYLESFLSEVPFLQEKGSSFPSIIRPLMQLVARNPFTIDMRGSSRYFIVEVFFAGLVVLGCFKGEQITLAGEIAGGSGHVLSEVARQ